MSQDVVRGSCLCGSVRFAATLPSKWVAHCHCTMCQRAHGAPVVTWAGFPDAQVAIEPDGTQPAWCASSPEAQRGFCPHCGSPMFFQSVRWPGEMHIARALFSTPLDRDPSVHVHCDAHVPWLTVGDDLPKKPSPT